MRTHAQRLAECFYLGRHILGYDKFTELHLGWFDDLLKHKRLLLVAPPGHLKSTCCTITYPLFRLTEDRNIRIMIVNEILDNAKDFLGARAAGMRSVRVRSAGGLYADLEPPGAAHAPDHEIATLAAAAAEDDCETLRRLLRDLGASRTMDFVGLTDAEGKVICRAGDGEPGEDVSTDPLIARALRERRLAKGTIVLSRKRLLAEGRMPQGTVKDLNVHVIADDALMNELMADGFI